MVGDNVFSDMWIYNWVKEEGSRAMCAISDSSIASIFTMTIWEENDGREELTEDPELRLLLALFGIVGNNNIRADDKVCTADKKRPDDEICITDEAEETRLAASPRSAWRAWIGEASWKIVSLDEVAPW